VTRYWINFYGRLQDAIGIAYPITIVADLPSGGISKQQAGEAIHAAGYEYNYINRIHMG